MGVLLSYANVGTRAHDRAYTKIRSYNLRQNKISVGRKMAGISDASQMKRYSNYR